MNNRENLPQPIDPSSLEAFERQTLPVGDFEPPRNKVAGHDVVSYRVATAAQLSNYTDFNRLVETDARETVDARANHQEANRTNMLGEMRSFSASIVSAEQTKASVLESGNAALASSAENIARLKQELADEERRLRSSTALSVEQTDTTTKQLDIAKEFLGGDCREFFDAYSAKTARLEELANIVYEKKQAISQLDLAIAKLAAESHRLLAYGHADDDEYGVKRAEYDRLVNMYEGLGGDNAFVDAALLATSKSNVQRLHDKIRQQREKRAVCDAEKKKQTEERNALVGEHNALWIQAEGIDEWLNQANDLFNTKILPRARQIEAGLQASTQRGRELDGNIRAQASALARTAVPKVESTQVRPPLVPVENAELRQEMRDLVAKDLGKILHEIRQRSVDNVLPLAPRAVRELAPSGQAQQRAVFIRQDDQSNNSVQFRK